MWQSVVTWAQGFIAWAQGYIASKSFQILLAGAVGAVGGSLGTQIIISRQQRRAAILAEVNSIRTALQLCFTVTNRYVSLMRQLVRPMRNRFAAEQQSHGEFQAAAANHVGPPPLVFHLNADMTTFSAEKVPIETLERCLYEKITLPSRALSAAATLSGVIESLEKLINLRNDLIAEIKQQGIHNEPLVRMYLGLPTDNGADERFKHCVEGIYSQTDDCIFYSRQLAKDLVPYGKRLRRRAGWLRRFWMPIIPVADWSLAEQQNLIPPDEQYRDWLRGFRKPSFWESLRARL